jgi:hypothetical protein
VPSLGVEENLTPEIIRLIGGGPNDMFSGLIVGQNIQYFFPPNFYKIFEIYFAKFRNFVLRNNKKPIENLEWINLLNFNFNKIADF